MLSYLLIQELREHWRKIDATVEENLSALSSLCGIRMNIQGGSELYTIPTPRPDLKELFTLASIPPPTILPIGRTCADTERKLVTRRK